MGKSKLPIIGGSAKKEGAYVWKKSTKPITLHFTQTSGAWGTPITLQVTSSEIDVNTLTGEDFVGVKGTCGSYTYEFTSATEFIGLTYTSPIEYSYSNGIITIQGTIASVETWSDYTKEGQFLDYVVSDNESAYPYGGEQGGYWYEKVVEGIDLSALGCTKAVTEKITPSSTTSRIYHSLGITPKIVIVTTESTAVGRYDTQGFIVAPFSLKTSATELLLGGTYDYYSGAGDISNHSVSSLTSEYIDIDESFTAGVEYIVTTIG